MNKFTRFSTVLFTALLAPATALATVPAVCDSLDTDAANQVESVPPYGEMARVIPDLRYRATSAITCYTYSVDCPEHTPTNRGKACTMTTPKAGIFPIGTEVQMPMPGTFQKLSTVNANFIFVETGIKDCNLIKLDDADFLQPERADVPAEFMQGNLKKTAQRYSLNQQNCILYYRYKDAKHHKKGHKEDGVSKAE